jgi:GT2 family glycosyltransferase
LDPEAADRLLEAGASSEAVAWTGVLRNDDGTIQRNTAPPPALRRQLAEYLLSADTRLAPTDELRRVGVITGALLCARTQTMRAVGGFDARYPLYMEDVELSVRLGELGPLVQFPIEVGVHTGGVSASRSERPGDLDVLLHASRVAWLRERSAVGATVLRAAVMAGSALRRIVRRGPRLDLRLLWRATARGFDLRRLLPGAQVRT